MSHTLVTHTIHEKKYIKLGDIDGDIDALLTSSIDIYSSNPYSNSYIYK